MSTHPHSIRSAGSGSFMRGLAVQLRVIGALLMRELHTRYGRENIGYLWMIMEPMLLAGAVALLHINGYSVFGHGIKPMPFIILGYTCFIIFRNIFNRASGAIESNKPLLYHRMVTLFDILLARTMLEFAGVTATFVILLSLAISIGFADLPYRPLHLLSAFVLMTWFAFGIGMIVCSLTYHSPMAERLVHPISYILMPTSGAFFMLEWIPDPYQTILSYFPMTLILEEARYGLFAAAKNDFVDFPYIIASNLFLTICGMLALKITRRHVHLS